MVKQLNLITNPAHYVEGRRIQPIHVIENWFLCHHLACVVKYLARAGRKNHIVEDLRKAEWYLAREVGCAQECEDTCSVVLLETKGLKVRDVSKDWGLSEPLSRVLNFIRTSKVPSLRETSLIEALKNLRQEMDRHES